jgi:hypothetical protein
MVESNRLIQACQEQGIIAERLFGEREILLEKAAHPEGMHSHTEIAGEAVAGVKN